MIKELKCRGIKQSFLITKTKKKKLIDGFYRFFSKDEALLLCWGSVAREEMSALSDLDLILIVKNPSVKLKINKFFNYLKKSFNNRVDLLEVYDLNALFRVGLIDGTDRQAILMSRILCGSPEIKKEFETNVRRAFYKQDKENFRELVHTWASLLSISENVYSKTKNNLKFSRGLLRHFNFIYLMVKLFFDPKEKIWTTPAAINELFRLKLIDKKTKIFYLYSFDFILLLRNEVHSSKKIEYDILDGNLLKLISRRIGLKSEEMITNVEHIQISADVFEKNMVKIIYEISKKEYKSSKDFRLFFELLSFNSGRDIDLQTEKESLGSKSEIILTLLAHRTKNHKTLEILRSRYHKNWYIVYGIANNINANPQTLLKLVRADKDSTEDFKVLYNSFAWRNIRLYVAKNKQTNKQTLKYIINHKNSRDMDIEAATQSLNVKNYGKNCQF